MSEMVERVARALFVYRQTAARNVVFIADRYEDLADEMKDHYLGAARAAIEAMREPTVWMIEDGHEFCRRPAEYSMDSADRCWRAMITAALKE